MLATYSRQGRKKTAVLENAVGIVETEKLNGVSELRFSLPLGDPKLEHCNPFDLVSWDGKTYYRLLDNSEEDSGAGLVSFEAEHVIAVLIDDVLFGTTQIENNTTKQVLEQILARQTTKNWVLGQCDFAYRFSYSWSNENILTALFSVSNRFETDYQWTFDTSVYPWVVNLKKLDHAILPQYYIRGGKNLLSSSKVNKNRDICTRLYALGYGEGINQLTFRDINGGRAYIEDAQAIQKYGLITRIWEDSRYEDSKALLERARVLLSGLSKPYEAYSVSVADLEKLTGDELDRAEAGKIVSFEGYKTYITQVERHLDTVGEDTLELANAPEDIAGSIADLADRQRIASVYAQGATNIYAQSFNDNADPGHPAVLRFHVPAEARQINKVILTWELERYRAYETGAESTVTQTTATEGGGGTRGTSSSGGGSNQTSSSGGESNQTSSNSGGSNQTSSESGGGKSTTDSSDEETTEASEVASETISSEKQSGSGTSHRHNIDMVKIGGHRHNMAHTHEVSGKYHSHTFTVPNHSHTVNIPRHSHTVSIPNHSHTVDIPDHTHKVSIPGHTHKIIYGIYEGPRANNVTLKVDGVSIPFSGNQVDVANYLSKDKDGKISRGTFHRIEIFPDNLTRISATLYVQLFIQSVGGGNY